MDEKKTLVTHLEELRSVIVSSVIFFALCFVFFLIFVQQTIPFVTKGEKLVMLGPLDVIHFYTGVAGSLSLGVSAPFIGYRLWQFVRPALSEKESATALKYIPTMFFSFVLGTSFGFFVVFPFAYSFLTGIGYSHFAMMITTREYLSFLLMMTLPMGFLFEVPFVLMFLTSAGLVTPQGLKAKRKYAYLSLAVISAAITPPDFLSQLIVLFPLFTLYEIGRFLTRSVYRKRSSEEGMVKEVAASTKE